MWTWIENNLAENPDRLRLKYHGAAADFDYATAILQIECRQRFGKKLSETLSRNPHFLFPAALSGEQSTSDRIARWHASMIPTGCRVVDLTAGLGIDAMHMARKAASVTAIERDPGIADALRVNSASLDNFTVVNADCTDFLANYDGPAFDIAFIDPARRGERGQRLFALSDCAPDVTALLPAIFRIARRLIVKASPMLDPAQTISLLPGCTALYIIGTSTECKEIVADVAPDGAFADAACPITAVNLAADGSQTEITFTRQSEASAEVNFSNPALGQYVLEPAPALMKAGCFNTLAAMTGASEISANTHVLLSAGIPADFPGTVSEIIEIIPYRSREIKNIARRYPRLEIATRNFGMSAETLRRQLHVGAGGPFRMLAVTDRSASRIMLIVRPIS